MLVCLRMCGVNLTKIFILLSIQTPSTAPPNTEMEAKAYEGKEKATSKKSMGTSGNGNVIGVRTGESGKTASS